jgi:glycosyltransferase involved in cell wall biosynthesis
MAFKNIPIRLIVFYQYFGTPKGGWSTRMYELPKRWVEAGAQVTVITSPYDKSDIRAKKFIDKQFIDGIEVVIVNLKQSNKHSMIHRLFTFILFSFISVYFALTRKYDLVLCSSGPITIGLPGLLAKLFRGKKFVFEIRDLWPEGAIQLGLLKNKVLIKFSYFFEKLCYINSSLVVTCSQGMTNNVLERYPKLEVLTIPNASDVNLFRQRNSSFAIPDWALNKKIFTYTGSLGLMDNCIQILKGVELVKDNDCVFVLIGEGKEKEMLMEYATERNIQNVFFLGLLPKYEVVNWLQLATAAFVTFKDLPMLQTSSPNKMFDAFAAGVPIIQTTKGWIKKLVFDNNCGINVDPNNPQEFANAVLNLKNDDQLQKVMAENSRQLGVLHFNRDKLAEQYFFSMKKIIQQ